MSWQWEPAYETNTERRAAVRQDAAFEHELTLIYLGFLVSGTVDGRAHFRAQLQKAGRVADRMEEGYGGRAAMTFMQELWVWTLHGRSHIE